MTDQRAPAWGRGSRGALGASLLDSGQPLTQLPCRRTGTPCRTNAGGKEQKTMVRIIERVQAHYESREMPFGKTYEWHPAYLVLECGCGKKWTIDANNTSVTRRLIQRARPGVTTISATRREHEVLQR